MQGANEQMAAAAADQVEQEVKRHIEQLQEELQGLKNSQRRQAEQQKEQVQHIQSAKCQLWCKP